MHYSVDFKGFPGVPLHFASKIINFDMFKNYPVMHLTENRRKMDGIGDILTQKQSVANTVNLLACLKKLSMLILGSCMCTEHICPKYTY